MLKAVESLSERSPLREHSECQRRHRHADVCEIGTMNSIQIIKKERGLWRVGLIYVVVTFQVRDMSVHQK